MVKQAHSCRAGIQPAGAACALAHGQDSEGSLDCVEDAVPASNLCGGGRSADDLLQETSTPHDSFLSISPSAAAEPRGFDTTEEAESVTSMFAGHG